MSKKSEYIHNLDFKMMPITALKPYEHNARKHDEYDVGTIVESIKQFGFSDPIGIWSDENIIVEGHGRYLACVELGIQEVPTIRLDHLTDEERRAYALAHNKTAENSRWDTPLLDAELSTILDIDMSSFGFDLEAPFEFKKTPAEQTQERVENILNLGIGQYDGDNKYDIPQLEPVYELNPIREWIGFNYVLSDKDPKGKGVHFFIDDYQFERIWNNPDAYVEKLLEYECVATPDFSPYGDMPFVCQLFNHYRKHWVGAFLQEAGVTVIPTIRASTDPRSFEWYLDGEPHGGIVMISSMWTGNEESREIFQKEYDTMYDTLKPSKVFLYGTNVEGLRGEIEFVPSFTKKRFGQ